MNDDGRRRSRRQLLTQASIAAAAGAALSAAPFARAAVAPPTGPEVDLGRTQEERILDAVIDICAETGYVSLTPERISARSGVDLGPVRRLHAHEIDFVGKTIDRLFRRRIQTYYANAAKLSSVTTDPRPGIDALARQFPDPVWIAYWDILFAIRDDPKIRRRVQAVTNDFDGQFGDIVPRFFPADARGDVVDFCFGQFDALGLQELISDGAFPRDRQLTGMSQLLEGAPR